MSKKSVIESLGKMKSMIEGNDAIAVNLQSKLLKEVTFIGKKVKTEPKERKTTNPSQFQKKTKISREIAEFAGWEPDSEHSRIEITAAIWDYVTKNELRDEKNKRICVLNPELKQLLKTDAETISYPQLQKFVTQHQIK